MSGQRTSVTDMEDVSDPARNGKVDYLAEGEVFRKTFGVLAETLGESAFSGVNARGRPQGYFSALIFEALTIGIQPHLAVLAGGGPALRERVRKGLVELKASPDFQKYTKGGGKTYAAALKERIRLVQEKVTACLP